MLKFFGACGVNKYDIAAIMPSAEYCADITDLRQQNTNRDFEISPRNGTRPCLWHISISARHTVILDVPSTIFLTLVTGVGCDGCGTSS